MNLLALLVTLSFTLPTLNAPAGCSGLPGWPLTDLGSVRIYGTRQSVLWPTLVNEWKHCHSARESSDVLAMWWPVVKSDADRHLLVLKSERGKEGQPESISLQAGGGWLLYGVACADTLGNEGCVVQARAQ